MVNLRLIGTLKPLLKNVSLMSCSLYLIIVNKGQWLSKSLTMHNWPIDTFLLKYSAIFASTKEVLPNLVLDVLCACELPVRAVAGEIEISGLSVCQVCRFEICAILKRHSNIQHSQCISKDVSMPCA